MVRVGHALVVCIVAASAAPASEKPEIVHVGAVAPDILGVTIDCDGWIPSRQLPLSEVRQEGDEIVIKERLRSGDVTEAVLKRDGEEIGHVSDKENDWFCTKERNICPPLRTGVADTPETWRLRSADDEAFAGGVRPTKVSRKTKPVNWNHADRMKSPVRHYVYLHLPSRLTVGSSYRLTCRGLNVAKPEREFTFDPAKLRSEAVHVSQVGFRPDDPAKRAYLSIWLGTGGAHTYGEGLAFALADTRTGRRVYKGKVGRAFPAGKKEYSAYGHNSAKTDVHPIDFDDFKRPGTYRVVVEGIGSSYPFRVARDAWQKAFITSMRGFYHQRSGVSQGPPYTAFEKERDMHPADGFKIYATTFDHTVNVKGQGGAFAGLIEKRTDTVLPHAWGGYHDAGDWDRRVQHLWASHKQLELAELFPDGVRNIRCNIPESRNHIPDVIDEALFNLDCYRRLQTPAGGVRHGIESSSHPRKGEVSWRESLTVMAFAPDVWSTYVYVATAARASRVVAKYDRRTADTYCRSALDGMAWAEGQYPSWKQDPATKRRQQSARDYRNHAALELYRLTEDEKWHDVFLEDTRIAGMKQTSEHGKFSQPDAAFLYAVLPDHLGEAELKGKAKEAILRTADASFAYGEGNAFNLHHPNRHMPRINGFFTAPKWPELVRAHYLSGEVKYLRALLLAVNFGVGANPMNQTLTTGLGINAPRYPLHIDSRLTGQPAPEGLSVYGIADVPWAQKTNSNFVLWPFKWFYSKQCTPNGYEWPVAENYFDVGGVPAQCEFTIMGPMEYACYNYGYLALRASSR